MAREAHSSGAAADARPTRKLFGTDGIRGVANEHPMTPELALQLGRAVTFVAGRGKSHVPRILIGKDTRLSGYMLEQAHRVAASARWAAACMLCGPMPTPAVAHLTVSMRADAGIVISASHNPYQDNGIKIFGADGFKLPDEAEDEIEQLMDEPTRCSASGRRARASDAPRSSRTRAGATSSSLKQHLPARPLARRRARGRRRGARRGLPRRAAGPRRSSARTSRPSA